MIKTGVFIYIYKKTHVIIITLSKLFSTICRDIKIIG